MSDNDNLTDKNLKTPLIISVVIHVVLITFAIVGLPYFKKDIEMVEPVPIDLIADISELTTTNKPPVKAQPPKEPVKEEPPPPKKEVPKPPQQKEIKPPDQKELEKPEPPKEPPKEEPKEKEPDMKDILDELAPPKEEPKPKPPEEKKPEPKKEEPKEDKSEEFDSLLKNLAADEPPQPDTPPEEDSKLMTEPAPSPNSKVSDVLTMSEMDALRQQLAGCWNIMSGATNAEDLAVEIKVTVNPDRTVANAQVVDQSRYNSDSFYRSMAESALRAVKNPRCSPLRLPEDKYNLWHSMTIVFDPKEMF